MEKYDIVILGTGQATGILLGKFIPEGKTIAVIEGGKVGGSCVNYGCTPTKTLVATAKTIKKAQEGGTYGFSSGEVKVDFGQVMKRMNTIRNGSSEGLEKWMKSSENETLIKDWGSFSGPNTILACDTEIMGDKIFINTGTRASVPQIPGLDKVDWLDNAGILELEKLPEHLMIIGGGYIGIEFAQVFARLGSRVTILQRASQLMPNEDEDIAASIKEFLEKEGITVFLNANTKSVEKVDEQVSLNAEVSGEPIEIIGSHLFTATGRKPNSDKLNLNAAGIKSDEFGYISVDDHCQTNVPGVFAVGDVNGKGAFTHTSVNDAEIVLDFLFGGPRKLSLRQPVYALFSDPPLGRVGLTEKEALKTGKKVLQAIKPMKDISRAKEMAETKGFVKLLVDAETELLLGAAVLGVSGDEVINMFALMMHAKIPYSKFREVVMVHPTVSELMPWTFDSLEEVTTEQ